MLRTESIGTFLFRFSKTNPGAYVLDFKGAEGKVHHILVDREEVTPRNFFFYEESQKKTFDSLEDIIKSYLLVLKKPYSTPCPKER